MFEIFQPRICHNDGHSVYNVIVRKTVRMNILFLEIKNHSLRRYENEYNIYYNQYNLTIYREDFKITQIPITYVYKLVEYTSRKIILDKP